MNGYDWNAFSSNYQNVGMPGMVGMPNAPAMSVPSSTMGANWSNGYGMGAPGAQAPAFQMPNTSNVAMPAQGWMGKVGGWLSNGQNLGTAVQGISALTSAYLGFQQLKQAKEALNLQKDAFNANLNNSIQSYNTSLEDRIKGRTSDYAGKDADVSAYLAKHSLKRG